MPAIVKLTFPPFADKLPKGTLFRKLTMNKLVKAKVNLQFPFFTVIWVDVFGVPFNTTGFIAVAFTQSGRRIATANFDNFGVAQFDTILTPTALPYVIRTFNRFGRLFRTRRVPQGVETFAIIG